MMTTKSPAYEAGLLLAAIRAHLLHNGSEILDTGK